MKTSIRTGALALAAAVFAAAQPSPGALVAEWDFQVDENLTFAKAGASTTGALQAGATVSTAANNVGGRWIRTLADGHQPAADPHPLRPRRREVGEGPQVGAAAGGARPPIVEAVVLGGVHRRQADRHQRVDAAADVLANLLQAQSQLVSLG